MQHGEIQAYIQDDRMVILQHDLQPMTFNVDLTGIKAERIVEGDPALERKALAYALWGPMTIRNRAYFNHSKNQRFGALTPEANPNQTSQDDEPHELR